MSQNQQNFQNKKWAAPKPGCRRKAGRLAAFHTMKKMVLWVLNVL